MIYGFTGHRPPKLGGYGKDVQQKLYNFAHQVLYERLSDQDYTNSQDTSGNTAIVGMAQGWDMAVAQACHALVIPYIAAVPYPGQESLWPDPEVRKLYHDLLDTAERVVYVSQGEEPMTTRRASTLLQFRNQYIVDHSDKLIALWDGSRGGTYNCMYYAESKKKTIINVWKDWEAFS